MLAPRASVTWKIKLRTKHRVHVAAGEADGPYYHQEWQDMPQTTPIISDGMNALRLPAFFENLGHSNVILTAGGRAFVHKVGPNQDASRAGILHAVEGWQIWQRLSFQWCHRLREDA
jgi:ribulose 1,5-bisphosphate carboxylase large subunit-like protein